MKMAIETRWLNDEKTTIMRTFSGVWTWEEFDASQHEVIDMLRSVTHNVHQLLDFTQSSHLPANVLTQLRNSGKDMPTNRGKSIVAINQSFYKQMYGILNRIFPAITERVVVVGTLDEALAHLKQNE